MTPEGKVSCLNTGHPMRTQGHIAADAGHKLQTSVPVLPVTAPMSVSAHHFLASALQTWNELTGRFVGMVCAEAPVLITCPVHLAPV